MSMTASLFFKYGLFISLFLGIAFWFYFTKIEKKSSVSIVCTTGMIADVVKILIKDHAQIICLMGPGVDPHMYRPRSGDVEHFQNADFIFFNGLHLEGKMTELFKEMSQHNKIVVGVGEKIDQKNILKGEGQVDPHIWHDVAIWKEVVVVIRDVLCNHLELYADTIKENATLYIKELDQLHTFIINQIQQIPLHKRLLMTAHDAFRYFGRAYGITVIGLQGVSTHAQIGLYDMQQAADYIVKHKIKTIFVESCIPHKMMEILQESLHVRGWSVAIGKELFADALGNVESGCDTYIHMMRYNVKALVEGLL
jgi:manganese/zinc/iron transport system substrate-binding protein